MNQKPVLYGPDNPHPLSRFKTELVWEGKYDEYGNRRPIRLPSTPLPLQRIETIDEPHDREKALQPKLFDESAFRERAHRDDFRNMLIWGDNKLAMASLLEQFRGKVDLIYIDPPFDVGADFTMDVQLGEEGEPLHKEQSIMEAVAYRDMWGRGTDSYLHMMNERLHVARQLLKGGGNLFVHCDWRVAALMRSLLDDLLTPDAFRNEITWRRGHINTRTASDQFPRNHDTILFYRSGPGHYRRAFKPYSDSTMSMYKYDDKDGRGPYRLQTLRTYSQDSIERMRKEGRIVQTSGGGLNFKQYLADKEGATVDDVWDDIPSLQGNSDERLDFETQKPEALVRRILEAASLDNDLVMDFFCGSGTTMAIAEKLGRRWIGVDLGRYAIHVSRKRLIQVQRELHAIGKPYRSFDVYNLGRYERQWWQLDRLKGYDIEHRKVVLRFYKATPLANPPNPLLHAKKNGAFVHVDEIDGIFSYDELKEAAQAAQASGGREVHCLAWEFEMELALKKQALEAETGLAIRLKYIPREIMEPNRTECQFFEAGYLEARAVKRGKKVDVKLVHFSPALAEAPEKEIQALRQRAVESPFDFIDVWAVDFAYTDGKPFEHHWQDFRTRKDRSLKTETDIGWEYSDGGTQRVCIKVIDVFGVDTTTVIGVEV